MSLYELYLKDALGSVANAKAEDPYLTGARSVASWQMQPQTSAEAIWGPAVQGLLAGFLAGQGKKNVNETAFNKIASSNLIKALNPLGVGVSGPLTEAQSLAGVDIARQYGGAMPEGWTAESGISDLMLQLAQKEAQDQQAQDRFKAQEDLKKSLMIEGVKTEQIPLQDALKVSGLETSPLMEVAKNPDNQVVPKKIKDLEDLNYKRIVELPSYKQLSDIEPNFKTLLSLKDNKEAAAAPAMITSFNRILDPNSTTREGEYKTINNNVQGILDQIQGDWRKAMLGETSLSKEAREALVKIAAEKYNEFGIKYQNEKAKILKVIEDQGGDRKRIPVPDFELYNLLPTPAIDPSIPAGMKMVRNPQTGETKIVPKDWRG